LKVQGN